MALKIPSSLFKDGASLWLVLAITERLIMDVEFLKPFSQALKKQAEDEGVSGKGSERCSF